MEKDRPLEKLTVKELKEMALAMGGITGVTTMKKEELLAAIKQAKGIPVQETREKPVDTIVELKKKMRELRAKREELREAGKRKETGLLKRRISRLKKKTRRLAGKAASKKTA
jgi:Rho termination factor, N-terminal domain